MSCPCGVDTTARLCAFCRRTVALFNADRCVTCTAAIDRSDDTQTEGRCPECRERRVVYGTSTRRLMILASKARSMRRSRAEGRAA